MQLRAGRTETLRGEISIPASKSHTIRAVLIASLANGTSTLRNPLFSEDAKAAINACQALGASIEQKGSLLIIEGFGPQPKQPTRILNMLNSGTSANLTIGLLAAMGIEAEITGDASLRSRPVSALTEALTGLGCSIEFLDRHGRPPLRISGRITGGAVEINASKSSQYVSSLHMIPKVFIWSKAEGWVLSHLLLSSPTTISACSQDIILQALRYGTHPATLMKVYSTK